MKLIVEMNLSPKWTEFLTGAGFEAIHWPNLEPAKARDREIMEYARAHGFVVITQDLDFSAILAATGGQKPSVLQIRAGDLSPGAIGKPVVSALRQATRELDAGALLTVDPARVRMRLLPLRDI
jgi:predicted nuclease of predicted toxin-antitoxin system